MQRSGIMAIVTCIPIRPANIQIPWQIFVLAAVFDWERWRSALPLLAELEAGLRRFYDPKLEALRRYHPNVGNDEDADAVDSWYLYHPMLNLGRMALAGDKALASLFLDSIEFSIKAACHFFYKWPIQYKVTDFSVITATAAVLERASH